MKKEGLISYRRVKREGLISYRRVKKEGEISYGRVKREGEISYGRVKREDVISFRGVKREGVISYRRVKNEGERQGSVESGKQKLENGGGGKVIDNKAGKLSGKRNQNESTRSDSWPTGRKWRTTYHSCRAGRKDDWRLWQWRWVQR